MAAFVNGKEGTTRCFVLCCVRVCVCGGGVCVSTLEVLGYMHAH